MLTVDRGIRKPVLPGGRSVRRKGYQPACRVSAGQEEKAACRWEFADTREIVL